MKGRGNSKTPERIVILIREAVAKSSQSAIAREIGLTQSAVSRYMKGIGHPTIDTIQLLANYFNETFIIEIKPEKA